MSSFPILRCLCCLKLRVVNSSYAEMFMLSQVRDVTQVRVVNSSYAEVCVCCLKLDWKIPSMLRCCLNSGYA